MIYLYIVHFFKLGFIQILHWFCCF